MMRTSTGRALTTLAAIGGVLAAMCATATQAHAGTPEAKILVRSIGATFAASSGASGDYLHGVNTNQVATTKSVPPGSIATFTAQIKNTGSDTAQYLVYFGDPDPSDVPTNDDPTQQILRRDYTGASLVTAGKDITFYAQDDGYITTPIAPGKQQTFTVKVTMPRTNLFDNQPTKPGETVTGRMDVFARNATTEIQDLYSALFTAVPNLRGEPWQDTANVGSAGFGPVGTQQSRYLPFTIPVAPAPVAPGKTLTFTAKVTNNSAAAVTEHVVVSHDPTLRQRGCTADFPFTASLGATPQPGLQNPNGGYYQSLAPKKSFALTFKVSVPANVPADCNSSTLVLRVDYSPNDGIIPQEFDLIANVART